MDSIREKREDHRAAQQVVAVVAVDTRRALVGGVIAAVFIFLGAFLVGRVGNAEAKLLLEAMFPSLRFLCSAIMAATATILTLLLTLLTFSLSMDMQFKSSHYQRIRQIAWATSVLLIAATLLLLFNIIPTNESVETPAGFYRVLYYGMLSYAAIMGGGMISIILMLFDAVKDLTELADRESAHSILADDSRDQ